MAGVNLWLVVGQSATTATQLKSSCYCLDSSPKKPFNKDSTFVCVLGWNGTVLRHTFSKPRFHKTTVNGRCGGDSMNSENTSTADDCASSSSSSSSSSLEWDSNRWNCHFAEVDFAENYASVLKHVYSFNWTKQLKRKFQVHPCPQIPEQWRWKLAAFTASRVYELLSSNETKIVRAPPGSKGYTNMRELVQLGFSQAMKKSRLCEEHTNFSRISKAKDNLDPFDGIYVGDFHPLGLEVVQLRRKYGHWDENSSDADFCEYVEAVKLTGDVNVPAGQVAFRARIGSINLRKYHARWIHAGVESYSGEGRKANIGFKNPKWVEGKLLILNGKVNKIPVPNFERAELGFLFLGSKRESNLVLLKRLTLPE